VTSLLAVIEGLPPDVRDRLVLGGDYNVIGRTHQPPLVRTSSFSRHVTVRGFRQQLVVVVVVASFVPPVIRGRGPAPAAIQLVTTGDRRHLTFSSRNRHR
jgi:hypothetical protein